MSGTIVHQPERPHRCAPGWQYQPDGDYWIPTPAYPAGTVWRCDCGQHWVSRGQATVSWRKERRRERRRRQRQGT
jgi:hypothetical protein